jgi:DNA topoisomerase I
MNAKGKKLVIVESPTKAKTISKFLGSDFIVESSYGHVRDLPKSDMGVDVDHDFQPRYIVPRANQKRVTALKKLSKDAEAVLYATDEDREGEAIAWHLKELLQVPEEKSERIVFHEITEDALQTALSSPRKIDSHMVDAQQARRILDRLVGYELSPFLWRKVAKGLSAGRVQSVSVRLIVEREREIQQFIPQEYWSIEIDALSAKNKGSIHAKLIKKEGEILEKFSLPATEDAQQILKHLEGASYRILEMEKKETRKMPLAPFTTSTLQQEANRRLRFSAKQTMMFAQQLYEGIETGEGTEGLITYMRTDSVNLSEKFLGEAQSYIKDAYGPRYGVRRAYKTKSKLAQEAHEAIRPTSIERTPDTMKTHLSKDQWALYDLIWRRAVASQMADAKYEATVIDIEDVGTQKYIFRATGQTLVFDGFTHVYSIESAETLLPVVEKGETVTLEKIEALQHFTKPPSRYSEASIVKVLEEYGIGRPSTYAPTISTIIERNYVQREEGRLIPTELAFVINDLLVAHFPDIVDYQFTARMEDLLDSIAEGSTEWVPVIREFYGPFKEQLKKKDAELSKTDIITDQTDEVCEKCGKPMAVKMGRFGKFLACTGFPECKATKPLDSADDAGPEPDPCEKCGKPMMKRRGRFGVFYGCTDYPDCKHIRSTAQKVESQPCPECKEGHVVQKITKKRRKFYSCDRYPDCTYATWTAPEKKEAP